MSEPAPYCKGRSLPVAGTGLLPCLHRTRHPSGLCPQHRPKPSELDEEKHA